MLEILSGMAGGIITSLGMGGGTILIILLTMIEGIDQHIAQATNIVFFIPTAIVAIIINIKHKLISWKVAVPIVIVWVLAAIIGANISLRLDTYLLKKIFGVFLAAIAFYEVSLLYKEYKNSKRCNTKNISSSRR